MIPSSRREIGHRKQSDSPCPSDRLSRALHRQARVAPPSMAQVTPLASRSKARARLGRPSVADFVQVRWLRSARSPSLALGCQLQLSLKLGVVLRQPTERQSFRVLLTPLTYIPVGKKPPYCCLSDHPPSPSRGLWRPSNITRDYAQLSCATLVNPKQKCPLLSNSEKSP